jgi:2',3'-cyclic-nucleotide 2'-phosphodiesterase (5'-nucleotidase family)
MKKHRVIFVVSFLLLTACQTSISSSDSSFFSSAESSASSNESSSINSSSSSQTSSSSSNASSSSQTSSSSSNANSSSETSSSSQSSTGSAILDFYSVNDLHGQVEYNESEYELGITRMATYLNTRREENPDGTVLLAAGDMWQGSASSNLTHGALVTDCMNDMGFDAMTIGNHDFDWGPSFIASNRELADFPFLSANIIDKSTGQLATDLVDGAYTMISRDGVDIGIIGSIDETCESDILTSNVEDYDFPSYASAVNAAANALHFAGAEVIVLLTHSGSLESGLSSYIDVAFGGHNHSAESGIYLNIPFIRAGCNGRAVGHFQVIVDKATGTVTVAEQEIDQSLTPSTLNEDVSTLATYVSYESDISDAKNESCGYLTGYMSKSQLGNMAVQTMLTFGQEFSEQNVSLAANPPLVAFHNTAGIRAAISSGPVIYEDIYQAFPFDNIVVICTLTGSQLINWLTKGNYAFGASGESLANGTSIVQSSIYRVVTIDFVAESTYYTPYYDETLNIYTPLMARDLIKAKFQELGTINPSLYD